MIYCQCTSEWGSLDGASSTVAYCLWLLKREQSYRSKRAASFTLKIRISSMSEILFKKSNFAHKLILKTYLVGRSLAFFSSFGYFTSKSKLICLCHFLRYFSTLAHCVCPHLLLEMLDFCVCSVSLLSSFFSSWEVCLLPIHVFVVFIFVSERYVCYLSMSLLSMLDGVSHHHLCCWKWSMSVFALCLCCLHFCFCCPSMCLLSVFLFVFCPCFCAGWCALSPPAAGNDVSVFVCLSVCMFSVTRRSRSDVRQSVSQWVSEWVSVWLSEWISEWVN